MTRRLPTTTGGTAHDAGRVNSQQAIENSSLTKWLDGLKAQSGKLADEISALAEKVNAKNKASEKAGKLKLGDQQAVKEVDDAIKTLQMYRGLMEEAKDCLKFGMTAQEVGLKMAKEKEEAKVRLEGNKSESLKLSGDVTTFGKRRAESAALEFAKGGFTMPVSER